MIDSSCYAPARREGTISVAFVCPSVCLSVVHIANNSRTRTQRPSVPKFERKVPHLRCDSHNQFQGQTVKGQGLEAGGGGGGRGHTVSAEPGATLLVCRGAQYRGRKVKVLKAAICLRAPAGHGLEDIVLRTTGGVTRLGVQQCGSTSSCTFPRRLSS